MRLRALLGGLAAAALVALTASPASAIRYGELDGEAHPYVGLMIAEVDGVPSWRCTGTLVDETHFLTAGHCTYGADTVEVWFGSDLRDREAVGYPSTGEVSGTPYTHPLYDDSAFFRYDLGVVVLDTPVFKETYGQLPSLGTFDDLFVARGQDPQLFTAVGYGLQRSMPAQTGLTEAELVRKRATIKIVNEDAAFGEQKAGNSVLFTNNASGGGTCNGDSGGPIFVQGTDVVAAVTSYGFNARCAGTGGGYRVDTADDLQWLEDRFGLVPAA